MADTLLPCCGRRVLDIHAAIIALSDQIGNRGDGGTLCKNFHMKSKSNTTAFSPSRRVKPLYLFHRTERVCFHLYHPASAYALQANSTIIQQIVTFNSIRLHAKRWIDVQRIRVSGRAVVYSVEAAKRGNHGAIVGA